MEIPRFASYQIYPIPKIKNLKILGSFHSLQFLTVAVTEDLKSKK